MIEQSANMLQIVSFHSCFETPWRSPGIDVLRVWSAALHVPPEF